MKVKLSGKRTLVLLAILGGVLVLYVLGEDQRREAGRDGGGGGGSSASNTTQCRIEATSDGINVRNAPAQADGNIIGELNQGDQRDAVKVVENGFRKLADGNWVAADLVKPLEGRDC